MELPASEEACAQARRGQDRRMETQDLASAKKAKSCATDYQELSETAIDALKRIQRRRSTLVTAFWKQAKLAL